MLTSARPGKLLLFFCARLCQRFSCSLSSDIGYHEPLAIFYQAIGPLCASPRKTTHCSLSLDSIGCVSLSHGNQNDHKGWRSVWDLNESGGGTSHGLSVGRGALLFIHTCKLLALGTRHPDSVSWLQGNSIACFGCKSLKISSGHSLQLFPWGFGGAGTPRETLGRFGTV